MAVVIEANTGNFDSLTKEGLVIVDFYATWCGPCKMIAPILHELTEEDEELTVVKVDVDANEELKDRFDIMSVPTLVFLKDGVETDRQTGYRTKDMLKEVLDVIR